jgi:sigma-B regulation protein RsbU (phosphoserine phosphatase)
MADRPSRDLLYGRAAGSPSSAPAATPRPPRGRRDLLEAAVQQVAEGVIVVDREGRFLLWNAAAERMIGSGPVSGPPHEWSSAYGCYRADAVTPYPPDELPLARAMHGESVEEEELFIRNPRVPEGLWISVNSRPLHGQDGELAGGVVVFRDVTARRRSDTLVRQLTEAIEKTTDSVFMTDTNAVIEYVNPAFESTTGYSREEALGRRASLLKSGWYEPAFYDELWRTVLSGEVYRAAIVNRRRDGSTFPSEQTITPVRDESGRICKFVSVMRDVTALKRAQEQDVEMRLARLVQQKLYPGAPPRLAGFDLAGAAFPADQTCGDYYDFLPMADGRLGLAVGDVSGHGFSAALLMAETRAYLRSLARTERALDAVLDALNAFLVADTEDHRFVTLVLALLDPARRSLAFASAGHIQGYVLDAAGATKHVLRATSPPLGLFEDAAFTVGGELPLTKGDLLLLLTDGAAEAQRRDGSFFETERVLDVVREARGEGAERIVALIHAAVAAFAPGEPQRDDITAVVCRVLE